MAAELKNRRWLGCEIGPLDVIANRFKLKKEEKEILYNYRSNLNCLFPEKIEKMRIENGLWTCDSVKVRQEESKA